MTLFAPGYYVFHIIHYLGISFYLQVWGSLPH